MLSNRSAVSLMLVCGWASTLPAGTGPTSLRRVIDAEINSVWVKEKITPAGRASDSAFLRRIYLDLVGVVPSYEETTAFLQDADPRKREKLVDKLLADPRFATQQAHAWDLALFGRHPGNIDATRKRDTFTKWLAEQFAKDVPYDQWVKSLLLAEQEGSELFYVQYRNQPEEATVGVTRIFLGTQLQCARCHDHPFEAWTQRDFYGMAGFFVRLNVIDAGGKKHRIAEKSTGEVLFSGSVKEQTPGKKGVPVRPKFLGGQELDEPAAPKDFKEPPLKGNTPPPKPLFSRKEKLVDWLTASDNPYFARAVANRVWAQFMGRGLVHPVDDLTVKNKASHPELFKTLTDDMRGRKFDLKGYIRELVNSDTYQLADTGEIKEALPASFERARVRPLSAEELMASLRVATGHEAAMPKNSDSTEYFLRYFGEPTDGQGHFQSSLAEHLFLDNAPQIRTLCQQGKGNLADWMVKAKAPMEERVERLFLSVLSRPPSAEERARFVQHLSGDAKMLPGLVEEAIWVLVSCAEFRFNR
jgi:Protein of unknown function (DUF1549)/Protein of unknown function (DUF1553)